MARKKSSTPMLDQKTIIKRYHLNKTIIQTYFPKPEVKLVRSRGGAFWHKGVWSQKTVEEALRHPEIVKYLRKREREAEEQHMLEELRALFTAYSPEALIERGKRLKRSFVLHVGPTNSGKTYQAIEDLKANTPGTYLGPLRLLALEMYDRINADGVPCSMLTGEESLPVPNALIVSSTIELCDVTRRFKTAVIDEAQLIADPDRGASWLRAICLVDAEIVHICMAPEALHYIEGLVKQFSDAYSVVWHKRLAPLRYAGGCHGYQDLRPDDALICFSRKSVLSAAAILEKHGFRASVIYGALPPEARRNEVRKYTQGENDIVVATDAIGMGISLPIKRVVFAETEKFDGKEFRTLTTAEINQIGGRAGRYGLNEFGEVLVMGNTPIIEERLGKNVRDVHHACIAFPREMLSTGYPLRLLLRAWQSMRRGERYIREDMQDAEILLRTLGKQQNGKDRELLFDLITCPVDTRSEELVVYWAECARAILGGKAVPDPYFETETLQGCELQYKAYDIRHQLLRRIGRENDCAAERRSICAKIALLMKESKEPYIRRCKCCGKELPIGNVFNLCADCYSAQHGT